MRQKLVAGNWKMNSGLKTNQQLLQDVVAGVAGMPGVAVAVCVPFPYLAQAQSLLTNTQVAWGAQNLSEQAQGAFTGETSAAMLQDFACQYVLVGHSERRAIYGESDTLVAEKFAAALAAGLRPILCVGETLAEREAGKTVEVVSAQMAAVLNRVGVAAFVNAVVAYEPVWAIGADRPATSEHVRDVLHVLRAHLPDDNNRLRFIYGGSAGPGLYKELSDTVDGLFLGRSAHDPRAFAEVLDEMLSVSRHAEVNAERASETPRKQHP